MPLELEARLRLGDAAALTVEEAAALLPVPREAATAWVRSRVRLVSIDGVFVTSLQAFREALGSVGVEGATSARDQPVWLSTDDAARRYGLNRKTLEELAKANGDISGGPSDFGNGRRHRWRWPGVGLEEWLGKVHARARNPSTPTRPLRASRPRLASSEDTPVDWKLVSKKMSGG